MRIVIGMLDYVDNDRNLDQNDLELKTETMYYFIFTNKLCVVWLFHQAQCSVDSSPKYVQCDSLLCYMQCELSLSCVQYDSLSNYIQNDYATSYVQCDMKALRLVYVTLARSPIDMCIRYTILMTFGYHIFHYTTDMIKYHNQIGHK